MSENYFKENRKFIGFDGVLGRRDFIVNFLTVELIEGLIWYIPSLIVLLLKPDLLSKMFDMLISGPVQKPILLIVGMAVLGLISVSLYYSSIVRRVRDILGEEDDNRVYLIASVLAVICYMGYTPVGFFFLAKWIVLFTLLYLICWSGKITANKPENSIVKFNWGAFWGTWIWGLMNKTPITLWAIPLSLTVGIVPFMLICGLKGNEWAYDKSTEDVNIKSFHNKQANFATAFNLTFPIIILAFFMFTGIFTYVGITQYSKVNPNFVDGLNVLFVKNQEYVAETSFDNIDLENGEYKFYFDPEDWSLLPKYTKISFFKSAIDYVVIRTDKDLYLSVASKDKSLREKRFKKFLEVAQNTKIYSTFNNEVLAEYQIEESVEKELLEDFSKNPKSVYKVLQSGYKFNDRPSIP